MTHKVVAPEREQEVAQVLEAGHRHARLGLEAHAHAALGRGVEHDVRPVAQAREQVVRVEARWRRARPEGEGLGAQRDREVEAAAQQVEAPRGLGQLAEQRGLVLAPRVEHEARARSHGHGEVEVVEPPAQLGRALGAPRSKGSRWKTSGVIATPA
jgi:hypothetical protein